MAEQKLAGVVGFFNDPDALLDATRKVKEAHYQSFDAFTPYPVHGLDDAMGLKRSPIPYVTFFAGMTGCLFAFGLQYWTSVIDWPLNVSGKPFNSWPAFVPVMFELTILFAGLATFGALMVACGFPNTKKKIVDPSITCDRFALMVDVAKKEKPGYKKFNTSEVEAFLKSVGATDVRVVYEEGWF